MVRCDDTGMVYAMQAERYYDHPDDDELAKVCMDCSDFDMCPGDCGWGMCSYYGEFKQEEQDACGHFTPDEPEEEPDPDDFGFFDPADREDR